MTRKEIEAAIKREKTHIARAKRCIEAWKYDIKASRKAVRFWETQLRKSNGRQRG